MGCTPESDKSASLDGSGRIKLDDDVVELRQFDVVRVAPDVVKGFEAGPEVWRPRPLASRNFFVSLPRPGGLLLVLLRRGLANLAAVPDLGPEILDPAILGLENDACLLRLTADIFGIF